MDLSGLRRKAPLVLFVEDSAEVSELFAEALAAGGFLVRPAATLAEAIALEATVHPDVVVMDRDLPDGDGFELASRWTSREEPRPPLVIGFTASPVREAMEAARRANMAGFVAKPCPPAKLVDLVRHLASERSRAATAC